MGIPAAGPVVRVAKAFRLGNIESLRLQVSHRTLEGHRTWSQPVDDNVVAGLVQGSYARGFVVPLFVHASKPQVCWFDDVRVGREQTCVVGFGHEASSKQ